VRFLPLWLAFVDQSVEHGWVCTRVRLSIRLFNDATATARAQGSSLGVGGSGAAVRAAELKVRGGGGGDWV